MILQALTAYYEALRARGEIGEIGWAETRVQYALELGAAGQLLRILPLESADEKGKAIVRHLELPAPVKRTSGVNANFLWDNSAYLLGIDGKGKPERTKQCFAAAKELHLKLLSDLDDPAARAICAFFRTWEPENTMAHPTVAEVADKLLAGANLTFWFDGRLAKESAAIRRRWQEYYDTPPEGEKMRCLVTGELVVPEDVHPAIKRVYGAQSSGAALVSFNADAFCSYGRVQNQNAPVAVEKQVAILYAVTRGILTRIATEDVKAYEAGLYTYLDTDATGAAAMQEIRSTGKLEADTEQKLKEALDAYTEQFLNTKPEK